MRVAGVMIIIKDGLVLSISRRYDQTKFGLIGGKCDPGETAQEAAVRETLEETSLKVNKSSYVYERLEKGVDPKPEDFHSYCYYAEDWEGDPKSIEDGLIVKWLTVEQLLTNQWGAFPAYNAAAFKEFVKLHPKVYLKGISK